MRATRKEAIATVAGPQIMLAFSLPGGVVEKTIVR